MAIVDRFWPIDDYFASVGRLMIIIDKEVVAQWQPAEIRSYSG